MTKRLSRGEKRTLAVTCEGEGSAMRSGVCPLEHGYIAFRTDDGTRYLWFTAKTDAFRLYRYGRQYTITATISPKNTISRPTITSR